MLADMALLVSVASAPLSYAVQLMMTICRRTTNLGVPFMGNAANALGCRRRSAAAYSTEPQAIDGRTYTRGGRPLRAVRWGRQVRVKARCLERDIRFRLVQRAARAVDVRVRGFPCPALMAKGLRTACGVNGERHQKLIDSPRGVRRHNAREYVAQQGTDREPSARTPEPSKHRHGAALGRVTLR